MLYKIARYFRDKLPLIWDVINIVNSWLFTLRFGSKLRVVQSNTLRSFEKEIGMNIVPICEVPIGNLISFFASQPDEAYKYFNPHGFDVKSIEKLQNNKSFLAYVIIDTSLGTGLIAGYCFIRSCFYAKGFRGRMVGIKYRGQGLATQMNRMMGEIGFGIGLRIFETVSKDNVASYRSALSASNVIVIEEMEHNEVFLEILEK